MVQLFRNCKQAEYTGTLVTRIIIVSWILGLRPSLLKAIAPLELPKPIK
ncbi:hypothetical protein [Nostoc sp. FACHB-888]|nr:hypothetical protein [Nostoc sp. FACHB-888]